MSSSKKNLWTEWILVTFGLLLVTRIINATLDHTFVRVYLSTIVAVLFLYVPVVVLWVRKEEIDFLDKSRKQILVSLSWFGFTALVILPFYLFGAHYWMVWVYKYESFLPKWSSDFYQMGLYQLLMVALPEEFFFRGYLQSRINKLVPRKWNFLGAKIGWGTFLVAFVFALAHSIIVLRWWHFSIFFPALIFGWLRERTGSITAPILWHAAANVFMEWFVRAYH